MNFCKSMLAVLSAGLIFMVGCETPAEKAQKGSKNAENPSSGSQSTS